MPRTHREIADVHAEYAKELLHKAQDEQVVGVHAALASEAAAEASLAVFHELRATYVEGK